MNRDVWTILGLSLGSCLVVVAACTLVLLRVRRLSLTTVVIAAGLVPLLALSAATLVNVRAMFLSGHDSTVTIIVLAAAVPASVLSAVLLARWITRGSRSLAASAGAFGDVATGSLPEPCAAIAGPVPRELAEVARELTEARRRLTVSVHRERALQAGHRELITFLSHDLRTPLAGIRALAEGLEDGVLPDVPAALADLRACTTRLDAMVGDLWELSRNGVTGAGERLETHPVSLQEVVDDVAAELVHVARARGVELDLRVPGRLPVLADAESLERAVANLVDNALRHTPGGGRVTVTGHQGQEGQVHLYVRDECGGIAAADLPKVFDVGWRGGSARDSRTGGAGLGLAIVRHVVAAHQGAVEVRNLDAGCQFDIVLRAPATLS